MTESPHAIPIELDCHELKARLDRAEDVVVIDCREPDEYEIVRLAAAKLIPMSELGQRVVELEPFRDRRIVVHCHHGVRSLRVVSWLRENGFAQAQSLAGGIDQWAAEIEPHLARY